MIRNLDHCYSKLVKASTNTSEMEPRINHTMTHSVVHLAFLIWFNTLFISFVEAQELTKGQPAMTHTSPGYLHIEISDDMVTMQALEVTIKDLLEEIAHQSGLVLILHDPPDDRVTMNLYRLPLPAAIDQILRDESFVFQYFRPSLSKRNSYDPHSSKLWVFSKEVEADRVTQNVIEGLRTRDADKERVAWGDALSDTDPRVRLKTATKLAFVGGDQAAAVLATVALGDGDSSVREEAIYALGEIGGQAVIQVLKQTLIDPDNGVREATVDAYAKIGGNESAMALATILNDADASLRAEAVDALGEIGGETAIRILQYALTDEKGSIQEAAAAYLAELSSQER